MSTFYEYTDKNQGDLLRSNDWNELSNAVAGNQGLHLALDANDKVGIGTTDPKSKLDVEGGVAIGATYSGTNAAPSNGLLVEGNVGIGTTNPGAPLSISGDGKESNPDGSMHITSNCILFGGNNSGKQTDSAQISAGLHQSNSLCIVGMSSGTSHDRKITMWAEGGLTVNGNVGIGTTNPGARLEVNGEVKATRFVGDGSGLIVGLNGLNLATEGGNVGIGRSDPQEKLHVNGTIRLEGAMGKFSATGDNSTYKERKEYIQFVKTDGSTDGARLYAEGGANEGKLVLGIGDDMDANEAFIIRGEKYSGETKNIATFRGDGNVGIGTTNPGAKLEVAGNVKLSDDRRLIFGARDGQYWEIYPEGSDSGDKDLFFHFSGNTSVSASGWLEPGGSGWRNHSDSRLKKNIKPLGSVLKKVVTLEPKFYQMQGTPEDSRYQIGFIAQEVEKVFPELITEKQGFKGLGYQDFGVLSVGAIKELNDKLENLTKKVATLAKKVK